MNKIRSNLAGIFSEKVYNGLWFSPEGEFVRSCLKMSQNVINGRVILELYKGRVYIVGRSADQSLYDQELVRLADTPQIVTSPTDFFHSNICSMDVQGDFTPLDSEGFIKTQAIRLKTFRSVYQVNPFTGKNWGEM